MYCQTCGAPMTTGQRHCKRCGAAVSQQARVDPSAMKISGLFWAIALFGFGSIAVLLGTMISMLALGARPTVLGIVATFGSATILAIAGLLIRQLSRLISIAEIAARSGDRNSVARPGGEQGYIHAPPPVASIPSVTEHTTRTFDPPAYQEAGSRE